MTVKQITLECIKLHNFKRFYGSHEVDLRTRPEDGKPIVLIGGDNGRGKTSLHEAISYALYEDDDLPGIHTRPSYAKAVVERVNRLALDRGDQTAWVELDLAVEETIGTRHLQVKREWKLEGRDKLADVLLTIQENGRPVDFIENSTPICQDYLRSLMPPRIADFFFFDGERIQQFADDEAHEQRMVTAIEDILHISVYKRLRSDIKSYVIDHIERHEIKPRDHDDYFDLMKEVERLETELEDKKNAIADVERAKEDLDVELKRLNEELKRVSSPHSSQRDELIAERAQLDQDMESARSDVDDAFASLPLLLVGNLRTNLIQTLQNERASLGVPEDAERLRARLETLRDSWLTQAKCRDLIQAKSLHELSDVFDIVAEEVFELSRTPVSHLHDVSESTRARILDRLHQVTERAQSLKSALDNRESVAVRQREVELQLKSISDDPHVLQMIERHGAIKEQIGGHNTQLDALKGELDRLHHDLARSQRSLEDRREKRKANTSAKQAVRLGHNSLKALDAFIRRMAPGKLRLLQQHMEEMYWRLRKSEDPVASISIDPDTWRVDLLDSQGRPLEKRQFSAGMKEMYALALLWALGKASGREMPLVIDTPVGRLDTTNRRTLFEHYLPHAGHQVVVLSTDTEVDREWAEKLSPYVARQYRLDVDSSTNSTVIRPGYFF